jgi:hypothetical protein
MAFSSPSSLRIFERASERKYTDFEIVEWWRRMRPFPVLLQESDLIGDRTRV